MQQDVTATLNPYIKVWLSLLSGTDLMALNQAEMKVMVSDPIFRADIDILERFNSDLLEDAIDLRRAQLQRGDHTESARPE